MILLRKGNLIYYSGIEIISKKKEEKTVYDRGVKMEVPAYCYKWKDVFPKRVGEREKIAKKKKCCLAIVEKRGRKLCYYPICNKEGKLCPNGFVYAIRRALIIKKGNYSEKSKKLASKVLRVAKSRINVFPKKYRDTLKKWYNNLVNSYIRKIGLIKD